MVREYILFKQPIQYETLSIVQYLHSVGRTILPKYCIERNHPEWITELPSIFVPETSEHYSGLERCVCFFEEESGMKGLLEESKRFKQKYPNYRIANA